MRVLVVGAGALGGYYGGRLAAAGRDVSFLVRPSRADEIVRHGLHIDSLKGDAYLRPRTVLARSLDAKYDLILLAVKAYALDAAMDDFAPAVGPETVILPVINGMRHLGTLGARFGAGHVLGGAAFITATLGPEGKIVHRVVPKDELVLGETAGGMSERLRTLAGLFEGAGFEARASEDIAQDMWEKWVILASVAGITCMMRASVGDVLTVPGGREALLALFAECRAIATAARHEPRLAFVGFAEGLLTAEGSSLIASMLRDIERGAPTEGEHILGDLAERAEHLGITSPVLHLARAHVAAYEARRRRETAGLS